MELFEHVSINSFDPAPKGFIRSIKRNGDDEKYEIKMEDGITAIFSQFEVARIEGFEAPFRFNEIVKIVNCFDKKLNGKFGVVSAIARDDDADTWGFALTIESGEVISLSSHEIVKTGRCLPPEFMHDRYELSFTPVTTDGLASDRPPRRNIHKFTPLGIDLETAGETCV